MFNTKLKECCTENLFHKDFGSIGYFKVPWRLFLTFKVKNPCYLTKVYATTSRFVLNNRIPFFQFCVFTSWGDDDVAEEDVPEHPEDEDDGVEGEEHPSVVRKNRFSGFIYNDVTYILIYFWPHLLSTQFTTKEYVQYYHHKTVSKDMTSFIKGTLCYIRPAVPYLGYVKISRGTPYFY